MRSFRVRISGIEVVNETKEVMDPFIRFIIGGNFFTQIKKRGNDDVYISQGTLGTIHNTDAANFLEGGMSQVLEREISTIYHASYFQLESELLHL